MKKILDRLCTIYLFGCGEVSGPGRIHLIVQYSSVTKGRHLFLHLQDDPLVLPSMIAPKIDGTLVRKYNTYRSDFALVARCQCHDLSYLSSRTSCCNLLTICNSFAFSFSRFSITYDRNYYAIVLETWRSLLILLLT